MPLARRTLYVLAKMGLARRTGEKQGNAHVYRALSAANRSIPYPPPSP